MRSEFRKGMIVKLIPNIGNFGIIVRSSYLHSYQMSEYWVEHSGIQECLNECFIDRKATNEEAMLWKLENA